MLYMGDEYGYIKCGNNNMYCYDNWMNWVNWDEVNDLFVGEGFARFVR